MLRWLALTVFAFAVASALSGCATVATLALHAAVGGWGLW